MNDAHLPAILALEDGTVFEGVGIGAQGLRTGEVVFNTAMTGYQEVLTDASYARQIVTLTHPHVGNTGCNEQDDESTHPWASGLVVRDVPRRASNWRSRIDLPAWLRQHDVVAIAGIDTRMLTRRLRERGAQSGALMVGTIDPEQAVEAARKFSGLQGMDLASEVSTRHAYAWTQDSVSLDADASTQTQPRVHCKVVVYDYGVKHNTLRLLVARGCEVHVVPATTSAEEVLAMQPDGVLLSNGPGDPQACGYAIEAIRVLLARKLPLFGICLGHQLLALAAGARTLKMPHGHHGANHPVQSLDSGRVLITSQNHGFCVDEVSLPANVRVTHRSLFDGSNQGIAFTDAPAFGFQGHPEAAPGPHDAAWLFDDFITAMQAR